MKIFKCEKFTTNEGVLNNCEGELYIECLLCTLNKNIEKKVIKGSKHRPPTVIIDDYTSKEFLDKCLDSAHELNDMLDSI